MYFRGSLSEERDPRGKFGGVLGVFSPTPARVGRLCRRGTRRALAVGMSSLPPSALSSATPLTVPPPARCPVLSEATSWTALLADTAWGMTGLERRRVRVKQRSQGAPREALRLVVQSYRESDVVAGRPTPYARPLASAQRGVSSEELKGGVLLDLVQFDDDAEDVVVIAWVEDGEPDLDFDGLEARPPRACRLAAVEPFLS